MYLYDQKPPEKAKSTACQEYINACETDIEFAIHLAEQFFDRIWQQKKKTLEKQGADDFRLIGENTSAAKISEACRKYWLDAVNVNHPAFALEEFLVDFRKFLCVSNEYPLSLVVNCINLLNCNLDGSTSAEKVQEIYKNLRQIRQEEKGCFESETWMRKKKTDSLRERNGVTTYVVKDSNDAPGEFLTEYMSESEHLG